MCPGLPVPKLQNVCLPLSAPHTKFVPSWTLSPPPSSALSPCWLSGLTPLPAWLEAQTPDLSSPPLLHPPAAHVPALSSQLVCDSPSGRASCSASISSNGSCLLFPVVFLWGRASWCCCSALGSGRVPTHHGPNSVWHLIWKKQLYEMCQVT